MSKAGQTWLTIAAAALGVLALEILTLSWDWPMSWAFADVADSNPVVVFLVGLVVGALAGHFWWPARAAYRRVWKAVREWGDPAEQRRLEARHPQQWLARLELHAEHLWRISLVLAMALVASTAHAAEPYVEVYATSGLVMTQEAEGDGVTWDQTEYVGAKVVLRLPWRDFAIVGRGEVKGLPGTYVYDKPGTYTALVGELGATYTRAIGPVEAGAIATYGQSWALRDDRGPLRESIWGAGLTVRHEATRSWIAAGFAQSAAYGSGLAPRLVVHAPILGPTALELDVVWGDAPAVNVSVNAGWSK